MLKQWLRFLSGSVSSVALSGGLAAVACVALLAVGAVRDWRPAGAARVLAAQNAVTVHRVVFVITSPDPEDWHSGMVLSDHFLAGVKPVRSEVEVLAYGGGIEAFKKGSAMAG